MSGDAKVVCSRLPPARAYINPGHVTDLWTCFWCARSAVTECSQHRALFSDASLLFILFCREKNMINSAGSKPLLLLRVRDVQCLTDSRAFVLGNHLRKDALKLGDLFPCFCINGGVNFQVGTVGKNYSFINNKPLCGYLRKKKKKEVRGHSVHSELITVGYR